MKKGAAARTAKSVITVVCDRSSCCCAVVREPNPSTRVSNPESPPREAAIFGVQAMRPGPKATMAESPDQMTMTINTQEPVRPHHSRSCSSVNRLARPMKTVAVSKNIARTPGTAKVAKHSANLATTS